MFIEPGDFIFCDTLQKEVKSLDCPHVRFAHLEEALRKVEDEWGGEWPPYLFSGGSDMGLWRQQEAHPNGDLFVTALYAYDWAAIGANRTAYLRVPLGPACDVNKCDPSHTHSIRTDRYTFQTMNAPPEGVVWHTANLCVRDPQFSPAPFGLNPDGRGKDILAELVEKVRSGKVARRPGGLYVNHREHTHRRLQLNNHYRNMAREGQSWVTYKGQVAVEEYLEDLASHQFALAPNGCGLDSYRLWECLALGTVPILEDSIWARHMKEAGLPVLVVGDLAAIREGALAGAYPEDLSVYDYSFARLSYWKEKIGRLANSVPQREDFLLA